MARLMKKRDNLNNVMLLHPSNISIPDTPSGNVEISFYTEKPIYFINTQPNEGGKYNRYFPFCKLEIYTSIDDDSTREFINIDFSCVKFGDKVSALRTNDDGEYYIEDVRLILIPGSIINVCNKEDHFSDITFSFPASYIFGSYLFNSKITTVNLLVKYTGNYGTYLEL